MGLPLCVCCGAQATIMRRNSIENGSESVRNRETGAIHKVKTFKPTESRWYCKAHAPAPQVPAKEFIPLL